MSSLLRNTAMEGLAQPLAIAMISFALGYQLRSFTSSSSSLLGSSRSNKKRKISSPDGPTSDIPADGSGPDGVDGATDTDSDAEDEAAATGASIDTLKAYGGEEVKLVLVVNDSLKMSKGKIAAQAGHATLACALTLKDRNPRLFRHWQAQGQPKIAVRCATTEDLEALAGQARRLSLCARTIQDAGRTQVAPGSKTILGIGPGPARLINTVTGKLKLL